MIFVNPGILWGLFAVSIPIIIHIFNLRKTRKIEFSTLMFLKEIQETKQKRIRLMQLLILLCRIAFIILLVTAFAGPFTKGFLGSINDKSPASVLILLDDSFSMNGRLKAGTDFDEAKKIISELLSSFDNSDEIYFLPVSKLNDAAYFSPYREKNSVADSLPKTKISDIRRSLTDILYNSKRILAEAKYPLREIYIVTDGQSSMFSESPAITEKILDDRTRMSIILTSQRIPNNVSIDSIDIKTKIFAPGRNVKIGIIVRNHNNFNLANGRVVFTSGSYQSEKVVDLPAGAKTSVDFSFTPSAPGYVNGKAELSANGMTEDEILNDNSRNFVSYVPPELKILIAAPPESKTEYLELALLSSEALTTDSSGRKTDFYRISKSPEMSSTNLAEYNAVVIIKNSIIQEEAAKLKSYLENGGGAIIYSGKFTDINNYNEILFKDLNVAFLPQRTDASAVFEKVDLEHPIFEGVFRSSGKDMKLESPSITSFISPQSGPNSQSLIKLNNGGNFLVQYNIGKGKLLIYGATPDYESSNFPDAGIFSPITVRSIAFVSKLPESGESIAGRDYYFDLADFSEQMDSLDLKSESISFNLNSLLQTQNSILNIGKFLQTSGIYSLSGKGKTIFQFPVNHDPDESLTPKLDDKEIGEIMDRRYSVKASVFYGNKPIGNIIREARSGITLWPYFLYAALFFLGLEYILAKSILKSKK